MQADASFWDSLVFGGIDDVDVETVTAAFGTVDVVARGRAAGAACPHCGRFSGRVHDSYQRRLKDLPLGGQSVMIRLTSGASSAVQATARAVPLPSRSLGWPLSRVHPERAGRGVAWADEAVLVLVVGACLR
jgi:zinc-finger of transposase IS204/IS1001/IS1096/IS1165